ncbi:MAG: glucan biosynthesis protein G [Steroidobacteraceae bacterium]
MTTRRISGSATLGLSLVLLTVPALLLLGRFLQHDDAGASGASSVPTTPTVLVPHAEPLSRPFKAADVVELARQLSTAPPRPRQPVTPGLEKLDYVQYRGIQFRIDHAVWGKERSPFRLDLLPAGFVYQSPVTVSVVEDGVARDVGADPDMFLLRNEVPKELHGKPLSLSGFRLRTLLNSRDKWDEFIVFQGASYFRAVGRGQWYGLSARGLALNTGEPQGEEFPAFTQFWIEKPEPRATSIVIHALLESASVTGAYRFTVSPEQQTTMDVEFTLFPRVDLRNVGIAPLTSMFLFDGSNHQRFDDFRDRVHDSDGLLFTGKGGEFVWRQLANPRNLQISYFSDTQPQAFGLMQRARRLAEFQDLEAHYELRPSAWVEFTGESKGAPGPLRLIEIPTSNETNDNIVAFWQPRDPLPAGRPYSGAYRLSWTAESVVKQPLGRVVSTRLGSTFKGDRKLMVLDLEGAGTKAEDLVLEVAASSGQVVHPVVQSNPAVRGLRATFEFDPGNAPYIEFRAVVRKNAKGGGKPVSETWLYRWTAS